MALTSRQPLPLHLHQPTSSLPYFTSSSSSSSGHQAFRQPTTTNSFIRPYFAIVSQLFAIIQQPLALRASAPAPATARRQTASYRHVTSRRQQATSAGFGLSAQFGFHCLLINKLCPMSSSSSSSSDFKASARQISWPYLLHHHHRTSPVTSDYPSSIVIRPSPSIRTYTDRH